MLQSAQQLIQEGKSGGDFSALELYPKNTRFETQDPQEEIVMIIRPHVVVNSWWSLLAVLLLFVPLAWPYFPVVSAFPEKYLFILTLSWYAFVFAFAFEKFLMWFFAVDIVTDRRIIDVDFFGLLFKQVDVAQLAKVQDINYTQKGLAGSIFNFGTVTIQTASETVSLDFENVPNPERVVKILSELVHQSEQLSPDKSGT